MRGKHGGGTRIIRVTDEEWDLVQKHRRAKRTATRGESGIDRHTGTANGPVRGIAMPIQEAATVHESARIPDRVLPHHKPSLSRQSRATKSEPMPNLRRPARRVPQRETGLLDVQDRGEGVAGVTRLPDPLGRARQLGPQE